MLAALLTSTMLAPLATISPQEVDAPLTPRERAVHLLSRFAFGPRPADVERLLEVGEEAWIEEQLDPRPGGPVELAERLADFETLELDPSEMWRFTYYELPERATRKDRFKRSEVRRIPMRELIASINLRQVAADDQLEEVLCEFWRNHFNVSYTKEFPAHLYITHYEARVVRDNALGSFPKMLQASAHHPAMMHYLDNALSRRPPSSEELAKIENNIRNAGGSKERAEEAARIAATRGLNENYARELLELHTLGVDRTYTQKDVIAVAEAFTGWGLLTGANGQYGFHFDAKRHIEGNKRFLGFVVREDKKDGVAEGERILEILAKHHHTADFIAMKLVRYLVNDQPPQGLVDEVAKTYQRTEGDVTAMVRTILASDEFWARRNYRAKFKTPNEFLVSAIRATGAELTEPGALFDPLVAMGQPTYRCDDPTGYYDTADAWLDPGVLAKRWEVALLLAAGRLDGVRIPSSFYGDLSEHRSTLAWMQSMVGRVLPGGASTRTLAMLHEVVREHTADGREPQLDELGPQVVGLLLGSPEFQQQ